MIQQNVVEALCQWFADRLPDVPFVEFGVPDERDEPSAARFAEPRRYVAIGERTE